MESKLSAVDDSHNIDEWLTGQRVELTNKKNTLQIKLEHRRAIAPNDRSSYRRQINCTDFKPTCSKLRNQVRQFAVALNVGDAF
jgi:hypothetical protein